MSGRSDISFDANACVGGPDGLLPSHGFANKKIAVTLTISDSTVKTHIANIFLKLDVRGRAEAVTHALQEGIIKL